MRVNRRFRFASGRVISPRSWRDEAACRPGADGSVSADADALFFPEGRQNSAQVERQVRAAKAVCAGCPVLSACRAWALANPRQTRFGVWGGLSEQERALVGKLLAARAVARARRSGASLGVAG